jgi:hypothetical protein
MEIAKDPRHVQRHRIDLNAVCTVAVIRVANACANLKECSIRIRI